MIINCVFEDNGEGKFTCKNCGLTVPRKDVKANCRKGLAVDVIITKNDPLPPTPPPLLNRIVNFIGAATKHAIAGNPTVSEEVLNKRLEICKSCPLFKPKENTVGGICTHSNCGCNIQDNLTYLNKIAWADQECPIGSWGKENGV